MNKYFLRYSALQPTDLNTTVDHLILSCHTIDTEALDTVADTVEDIVNDSDMDANDSLVATEQGDFTNALRFHLHTKSTNKSA